MAGSRYRPIVLKNTAGQKCVQYLFILEFAGTTMVERGRSN